MAFGPVTFASGRFGKKARPDVEGGLFDQLCHASHFLRDVKFRLRYGEVSRAPLRLLRFQITAETLECDWMARLHDVWDGDLSTKTQQRHASLQALRDALDMRGLLFDAFPQVEIAKVRAFRENADYLRELIIEGSLHYNDNTARDVHSLVMRAKILGFRFRIDDEVLQPIESARF